MSIIRIFAIFSFAIIVPIAIIQQPVVTVALLLLVFTSIFIARTHSVIWAILIFLDIVVLDLIGFGTFKIYGIRVGLPDIYLLVLVIAILMNQPIGTVQHQLYKHRTVFVPVLLYTLLFMLSVTYNSHVIKYGIEKFEVMALEMVFVFLLLITTIPDSNGSTLINTTFITLIVPIFLSFYFLWVIVSSGILKLESYAEIVASLDSPIFRSHMFSNKNNPGAFFVLISPLLLGLSQMMTWKWQRFLCILGSLTSSFFVLALLSRGTILGLGAAWILYFALASQGGMKFSKALMYMLLLGLLSIPLWTLLSDVFLTLIEQQQYSSRIDLIRTAFAMIEHYPVFGIGFSELEFMNVNQIYLFRETLYAQPHNSFLYMWVFGGTPLMIAFLFMLYRFIKPAILVIRRKFADPLVVGGIASLVGFFVNMMTDRVLFITPNAHLFFIVIMIVYLRSRYVLDNQVMSRE